MVIPEKEQQARKKRRDDNPNSRRRSNPNDVTANMLSKQGRHRHTRGPPTKIPRKINNSEEDNTDDHTEKKRPSKKKARVSSTTEPEKTPEMTETEKAPIKREFQQRTSHTKVASLIAKCLPQRDCQVFLAHFDDLKPTQAKTKEELEKRDAVMKTYGSCRKTPIWSLMESLKRTYGSLNVKIDRMEPGEFITSAPSEDKAAKVSLKFYLLDCILDRRVRLPGTMSNDYSDRMTVPPDRGEINEVVWKVPCKSEDDLHPDMDHKFAHAITVVPDAMVFYTYMERLQDPSLSMDMSLIPMGISWLRLLGTKEGWFAKGGYVKYLLSGDKARINIASTPSDNKVSAWAIEIFMSGHRDQVCRLYAIQSPDLYGPRWPPDIFPREAGHVKDDSKSRRDAYMKLLNNGNTTRIGAKWHVSGTLYSQIPPTALVVSPKLHGAHDIIVSIQRSDDEIHGSSSTKTRDISIVCQSVVSIRYLNPWNNDKVRACLQAITENAETIRKNNTPTVRNDPGDKGKMYALGCKVDPKGECLVDYAGNKYVKSSILPNAVEAMEYLGSIAFPSVLRPIQDMERAAGCECLPGMEKVKIDDQSSTGDTIAVASEPPTRKGSVEKHVINKTTSSETKRLYKCKVGLTMDISCNLHNSAHYDVNDATPGYAVWTETRPGNKKQRWYFVLPNVFGKRHDDTTYEGVAIELEDGVAISWDGRRIKHCSFFIESTKHPTNFLFGTFCGTKSNLINCGLEGKGQLKRETAAASMPIDTVGADDIQRDKMKAGLGTVPAINTNDMRVHGHLSEPIPKKHMKYGPIGDDDDRKVAAVQKKSPITAATLDYATMRARCFPSSTNSETPQPHQVVDVTQAAAAPKTPIEIAVLLPKNNTPVLPPTTKVPHSSPYNWWIQLNHIQKLKFLIDDKSTTEQQGGPQPKQQDLDLIIQQIFPRYVLSPPPPDMMAKMETAVQEAVNAINMYYDGAQAQIDTIAAFADSDEDSRQGSGYSSDSTFQGKPVKPSGTYYWGKFVHRANAIEFVRALPRLLLTFTCSFHAQNEVDEQCYCPCSYKAVSPWMDKLMDASASSCIAASFETAKCNKRRNRYTARSLLSHLHGSKDPIHQAVHVYVKHIYTHFYAKNTHHEALYGINSADYKRALIMKYHTRN